MGRIDHHTRQRVIKLWKKEYRLMKIHNLLWDEDINVSKNSLCSLIKKFRLTGSVADRPRRHKPRILTDEQIRFLDDCMAEDDELPAR